MSAQNKKSQRFISTLLLILIIAPAVLFSIPKKANAFWGLGDWPVDSAANIVNGGAINVSTGVSAGANVAGTGSTITNTGISIKNLAKEALKQSLMAVGKKALQQITKSTINWINSGFHGSPLFLENPGSFFRDIAKSEVKTLVNLFGYDSLKYPFGRDFALNTINAYKRTLDNNAAYSLSAVMTDPILLYNFQNNFNYGGWNGFLINTQYPQNNYLGFQMLATEELARRVQGTEQTAVQKVQTLLQQGNGFLSPQICPTNPKYNNGTNEFQKPSFKSTTKWSPPQEPTADQIAEDPTAYETWFNSYNAYLAQYKNDVGSEEAEWNETNTCPGGLVNTTPGVVASNLITTALGVPANSALQAMGLGNSLSAVFDALLNHFIDKGLNSLASTANPPAPTDTWSYNGQTLGTVTSYNNGGTWDSGPDEPIELNDFKNQISGYFIGTCDNIKDSGGVSLPNRTDIPKAQCDSVNGTWAKNPTGQDYIPGDIANTQEEIALMDNPSCNPADPIKTSCGIIQLAKIIPLEAQTLDQCLPGPDKGWENRLKAEESLVGNPLKGELSTQDEPTIRAANGVLGDLKFAATSFEDWIITKMISSLPDAVVYMDAIKAIDNLSQQSTESTDARRAKSQTLARLQAIATSLNTITKQPASTDSDFTTQENKLVTLKKQYNAIQADISSTTSIENTKSELNTLIDQLSNLNNLLNDPQTGCIAERTAAGWGPFDPTGKGNSINKNYCR